MRIVLAGGGLAAQRCAETLRRVGHEGPLTMICGEEHLPYDRPPLSKELLAGTHEPGSLRFRERRWYADHDVDLLLGTRATALHPGWVDTTAGPVGYDRLLVATGARPRMLPGLEGRRNVHVLRDVDDALTLRAELRPGCRLAVLGGGFVGLEVASTALALGAEVTVIEAAPAPLAGVLGERVGDWFAGFHRRAGVDVRVGHRVSRVHGADRVEALDLDGAEGERLEVDAVLVAIGVDAATEWARGRFPGVWFAGDAAGHHHWEAAARGGAATAREMLGLPAAPSAPESFWSDQHGVRIQLVGEPGGHALTITGDPEAADFQATWSRGARPAGVLLVGRPASLPEARRLVAGQSQPERNAA